MSRLSPRAASARRSGPSSFDWKRASSSLRANSSPVLPIQPVSAPGTPTTRWAISSASQHKPSLGIVDTKKRHEVPGSTQVSGQISRRDMLLAFREYLVPQLRGSLIATTIILYAELDRYGVVPDEESSREETERLFRLIHLPRETPEGASAAPSEAAFPRVICETFKDWFLPGWFLMSGAQCAVLRVQTPSRRKHYVLLSAYTPSQASPTKLEAKVYDSGAVILLKSTADILSYLHVNGYSNVLPMAIGYPKHYRRNRVVDAFLALSCTYFDISPVPMPSKVSAVRSFISERNRSLETYFRGIDTSPPSMLRFKERFILSRRASFQESKQYDVSVLHSTASRDRSKRQNATENEAKLPVNGRAAVQDDWCKALHERLDVLPQYLYVRKRQAFPFGDDEQSD